MKVIVNFGENKVVVPCGTTGDLFVHELIQLAMTKYSKLSSLNNSNNNNNQSSHLNSEQVQLRLNNGAVLDPDDRVCDVVDDREEIFAILDFHPVTNGELTSSMTSSNLSTSLSDHDRPAASNPRHEVIVTDADLRSRSLRVKTDSTQNLHPINLPNGRARSASASTRPGIYNLQVDEQTGDKIFTISLPKENSPLGIHVIPCNNQNEEQVEGLVLQTIELDGRIKRQGILEINDRIIEINRTNIEQCSFDRAQQIFRNALLESELELRVIRSVKKSPSSFFLNHPNGPEPQQNTKRLGKLTKITLIKGPDGLGFKLASRDNPTGAANPIYVKTIFGKGAAMEDGRLQNGDRLLMVNSIDVTQMSLQDAVGLLRETRVGDTIHLCVSRQQDGSLPKDLMNEEIKGQLMTFDIPLRDTSSAGLGITLKGKTSIVDHQSMDMGIFVKSILTGGAAYRDTRLRPNDQILVINESSLVNLSNLEAANILHDAVRKEIHPGYIKISISRLTNPELDASSTHEGSRHVQETDLSPALLSRVNDENELDLTNFVPSVNRKTPSQDIKSNKPMEPDLRSVNPPLPSRERITLNEKQNHDEPSNGSANPFERETPFRQSISEKRRVNQQPNQQVLHWKQQSFHEDRAHSEHKFYRFRIQRPSSRNVPDSNNNNLGSGMIRSTSFESLPRPNDERSTPNDDDRKRHSKLRNRAWNDSFRQAVDKSYGQTHQHQTAPESSQGDKSSKGEKQRFKFSNLFATKSKRRENQDDNKFTSKASLPQHSSPIHDNSMNMYPPPPPAFSSRDEPMPPNHKSSNSKYRPVQGYQPHRFDANQMSHSQLLSEHESRILANYPSKVNSGKSSITNHPPAPGHAPLPREFYSANINGTQSLRHHPPTSRSTFHVPPSTFNSYSQAMDFPSNHAQPMSRSYLKFESPANV